MKAFARLAAAALLLAAPAAAGAKPERKNAMPLQEGSPAPAFTARADDGKTVSLSDFRGKSVVLYFYPKDDTPGCTKEACSFRDGLSAYTKKNAVVLGVSADDAKSHAAFKTKYGLPFTLLADTDGNISRAYGVYNEERRMAARWTFVIDPKGTLKKIFPNVTVDGHSDEVLNAL